MSEDTWEAGADSIVWGFGIIASLVVGLIVGLGVWLITGSISLGLWWSFGVIGVCVVVLWKTSTIPNSSIGEGAHGT